MSYEEDQLRARIVQWFANNFNRESFELSMDQSKLPSISTRITLSFLAQGVALFAMLDDQYFATLVAVRTKLGLMAVDLHQLPGGKVSLTYYYAMIARIITDYAVQAVEELRKS